MRYAALLTLVIAAAAPPVVAAEKVLAQYSGSGEAVTPKFRAEGPFNVRWRAERAADFRILLKGLPEGVPSIVADPAMWDGAGDVHTGTASYYRPGDYFFEVRAAGPWRIEVVADGS